MWIVGIILIAVGVGLFFYKKKVEDKLLDVKYYDKTDIKSALDTCTSISQELGSGHYSQMVKVSAKTQIQEPFIGEFSDDKCVYFEASAEHQFEKLVESKDSEGKTQRRWVSGSSTIGSTKEGGIFTLNDGSAEIEIDIEGSDLTMNNAVNDFKSTTRPVRFSFGAYNPESSSRKRSQGYREIERNIPLGQELFVVGELHDRNGAPAISLPAEKKDPFIVSIHSEEKVIGGLESKIKMVFYGSIASVVIGVGMIIGNFFV